MPVLDSEVQRQLKTRLEAFSHPVTLHVFTQELECQFCRENRQLCEEIAAIVPAKVKVEVHNFQSDKAATEKFKIDKIPAIAVVGKEDYGIRFFGVPAGYEFNSLLSAMKSAAEGKASISQNSLNKLGALTKPIQIKVYVTLTCPNCPQAVQLAHQLAIASPLISAEMIAATEFPHLVMREQVMGVPKTVIAGYGSFEGALPEIKFIDKILEMVTGGSI